MNDLTEIKNTSGKIMSVDFGDTRTGLAVSDPSRLLASGIGYLSPGGIEKTADAVADAAKENLVRMGIDSNDITVIINGVEGLRYLSEDEPAFTTKIFIFYLLKKVLP